MFEQINIHIWKGTRKYVYLVFDQKSKKVRKSDLTFTNQNDKLGKNKIKKFISEQNFKVDPIGTNFFVTTIGKIYFIWSQMSLIFFTLENGNDDETTRELRIF